MSYSLTKKHNVLLIIIIVLAIILRIYNINFQSYWLDEIANYNIFKNRTGFKEILKAIYEHPYVPYYYYLQHIIDHFLNLDPISARITSALWGTLGVWSFYLLATEFIKNRFNALLATLFYSLAHPVIYYSQELAPYAMIMSLACIMTWSFLKYIETRSPLYLATYLLINYFFVGVHFLLVVLIFAHGIAYLVIVKKTKYEIRTWFFIYASIIASFLPWMSKALMLNQSERLYDPSLLDFNRYYYRLFKDKYIFSLVLTLSIISIFQMRAKLATHFIKSKYLPLLIIGILPIIILFFKSLISTPSFQFRYMTMCIPYLFLGQFIILEKVTIYKIKSIHLIGFICLSMFLSLFYNKYYKIQTHPDFKNMSTSLASQFKKGDIFFCNSYNAYEFDFYFEQMGSEIRCIKNFGGKKAAEIYDLPNTPLLSTKKLWFAENTDFNSDIQKIYPNRIKTSFFGINLYQINN